MAEDTLDLAARPPGLAARLAELFTAERERWPLWLPVIGGIGILVYFALPEEPPAWIGAAGCGLAALALAAVGRRGGAALAAIILLAGAVGFTLAQIRTARLQGPMLVREIGPGFVEGRVVGQDILPAGVRVVLDRPVIEDLAPGETPRRVRIRLTRSTPPPPTGARIRVLGVLDGPSPPVMPGAFDFRRYAFFQGIGGIGYAVGHTEVVDEPQPDALALGLERLRQDIGARVHAVLEGDVAAISAALINGERGAISDAANQAMRDSGLAHLLSISGLHIGLVAIIAFGGVRLVLALVEPLALRFPIKKWAAAAALLVTLLYTILVGAPVPTQRSFLMTGIVLLAVMLDRNALSMRLIAWAAVAVLAVAPDSLLGPSFQMSFGAVLALIAAYEAGRERFSTWRQGAGPARRAALYLGGVLLTTLIASLATTPFAVYHFQRFATYGIAANLLAVPLTSAVVMPCALFFYLLMPFGLEAVALVPMGVAVRAILRIAETTSGWPGATLTLPAMPVWGILAVAAGLLWLCLWRRRWRYLGLVAVLAGMASIALPEDRPDVLISDDGRLMAVRDAAGALALSSARRARFVRGIWLRRNGQDEVILWPEVGTSADGTLRCDPLGCLYDKAGRTVALVENFAAFAEDCAAADIVVASIPAPRWCRASVVIDRFDVWRRGAHALTIRPDGVRIDAVADRVGDRPWSLRR